jgi:hypothetical protein
LLLLLLLLLLHDVVMATLLSATSFLQRMALQCILMVKNAQKWPYLKNLCRGQGAKIKKCTP